MPFPTRGRGNTLHRSCYGWTVLGMCIICTEAYKSELCLTSRWDSSGISWPETRRHEGAGASPWKKWKRQRYQVPPDLDLFTLSLIMTSEGLPTTCMSVKGALSACFKYLTVARFKNAYSTQWCFQMNWMVGTSLLSIKMNISSLSLTHDKVTPVWCKTDLTVFPNHKLELKLFGFTSHIKTHLQWHMCTKPPGTRLVCEATQVAALKLPHSSCDARWPKQCFPYIIIGKGAASNP